MIGGITRALDSILGRGEAAVTVPPFDGALRPNRLLDEAPGRMPLEGVDCLVSLGGELVASAGEGLFALGKRGKWTLRKSYGSAIACLAPVGEDGLAVALGNGYVLIEGGRFNGRRYRADRTAVCITAMAASGGELHLANGSATNAAGDWQRDLLERNASGSIWRIDLETGGSSRVADGLSWPAGLAVDGEGLVYSEAWRHRLVRLDSAKPSRQTVLHADLPGYPGRISSAGGRHWLAVFAPRSQLVEFVLREPAYRRRMMAEVPPPFWVSPKLRSGRGFYETLQGGGVKHLGLLKPWAPVMSAGLCVRLDAGFQPRSSLHSRADGTTHGVTSVVEHDGHVFAAARGDGVVVSLPAAALGDEV
jgi:hypothetical protein